MHFGGALWRFCGADAKGLGVDMVKGKRVLLGLGALLTVGVLFGSASSGSAASPAVTFTLSCSPGVLTPGTEWGCSGTITNNGPQTAAHMTLVQEIEGASL